MGEQYIYLIRMIKEGLTQPVIKPFLDKNLAWEYFSNDVKYYRKKDWTVDDNENECGSGALRRAFMTRLNDEGKYEHVSLVLERLDIIKN